MRARVTLGVGLPYQIDRATLAVGLSFCLHTGRVTLSSGSGNSITFCKCHTNEKWRREIILELTIYNAATRQHAFKTQTIFIENNSYE